MIIAKIICPIETYTFAARNRVMQKLVKDFGGYTHTQGDGAWRDDSGKMHFDSVSIFECAIPDETTPKTIIRNIALEFGERASQQSVYITIDGVPEFIDTSGA